MYNQLYVNNNLFIKYHNNYNNNHNNKRSNHFFKRRKSIVKANNKSPLTSTPVERISSSNEIEYKTTWTDVLFIGLCRKAYGNLANWQSNRNWFNGDETYKGMVEVSRALMKGRNSEEQRNSVISGFPEIPEIFRKIFPYSKWGAELNAKITLLFFQWLVGPMEITEIEVNGQKQNSGVHIKQCRYLKESNCVGMCVNLCKSPCQTFFTEQLGMPLTMNPNFEDYSCEMCFGQHPVKLSEDPVSMQTCLKDCITSKDLKKCWKLN